MNSPSKQKARIVTLHGWLGLPCDWKFFEDFFSKNKTIFEWIHWDLFECIHPNTQDLDSKLLKTLEPHLDSQSICLAYSMGARIALQLALKYPKEFTQRFSSLCMIGVHPGLEEDQEKQSRTYSDKLWIEKLEQILNLKPYELNNRWKFFLQEWNQQPVFHFSKKAPQSQENTPTQNEIKKQIDLQKQFSLGQQKDLRPALKLFLKSLPSTLNPFLHYINGEHDSKFQILAQDLLKLGAPNQQKVHIVQGSGHRVPWEQPEALEGIISNLIRK